jgi:DNA invertase Pin-like site-specific DNA recombinase
MQESRRFFLEITETFIDRARSGKDTNRPELQRLLLTAIRRREVTLVMVTELSWLSRSIKDFAEIWEMMQAHDCGFLSLRENFDTTTAAGEMVLYSLANIAQYERRQVSERKGCRNYPKMCPRRSSITRWKNSSTYKTPKRRNSEPRLTRPGQ